MSGYVSLSDFDHDPALATELGNMVVVWAYAEEILIQTLACILNAENLDMIQVLYYRIPTFEARTKVIRGAISEWNTTVYDKDAIAHLVSKLGKLAVTRNGWVHGDWCRTSTKPYETVIFNFRVAGDAPDRRRPVKAADVRNHNQAVRARAKELNQIVGPWIDKYFESRHGLENPQPQHQDSSQPGQPAPPQPSRG